MREEKVAAPAVGRVREAATGRTARKTCPLLPLRCATSFFGFTILYKYDTILVSYRKARWRSLACGAAGSETTGNPPQRLGTTPSRDSVMQHPHGNDAAKEWRGWQNELQLWRKQITEE